ncbi:hypothetical protein BJ912DRAFT_1082997 [Pholiota molesta]|nr:hypothetical protein BJ912DRAFT_1082997 [Pholiota molesta]
MSSQTAPNPTFSRFSRGGFGFASRNDTKKKAGPDDEWYIPYNGPYELPRDQPRREKARDSWGDVLEDFDDAVLGDKELQMRYGGDDFASRAASGRYGEDERKGRTRDRTFSGTSGRTMSSGALDPGRGSLTLNRRSTVSAAQPPPLPSYVSIDAIGGGVGESPMPHVKTSKDAHRISIASIFSFGGLNRKPSTTLPFSEPNTPKQKVYGDRLEPTAIDENDYFNSYYETLIHQPDHDQTKLSPVAAYQRHSPSASSDSRGSSQRRQDYVAMSRQNPHPPPRPTLRLRFPSTEISPPPQSAPLLSTPHTALNPGPSNPPRLVFTTPSTAGPSSAGAFPPPTASGSKAVKTAFSTPNLRDRFSASSRSTPRDARGTDVRVPKGKERWLSAETWCDAVLFPRPRLRVKQEILPHQGSPRTPQHTNTTSTNTSTSTGRIVSPPVTPTEREFEMQQKEREPGVASRVLAHSRSLVDLRLGKGKKKAEAEVGGPGLRPPRPKSFAMDDLALPSPVPSLAHVLREGALLESERREWQRQAQRSFGNTRSRTVSRTRSKSLTQRARARGHHRRAAWSTSRRRRASAARTTRPRSRRRGSPRHDLAGTHAHSHSNSNSLVKTLTKSSKAHSRTHSRSESGSKPAPRRGDEQKAADLEGALRSTGTRVIRLADPAHLPLDRGAPGRKTPSPAFSAISDSRVGIALGTPPEEDADASVPYLPAHPAATRTTPAARVRRPPRARAADDDGAPDRGILARHKLPPHMVLHPYAQPASRRDSYIDANGLIGQFRSEAGAPHAGRMWAQLSPSSEGVVQEVLPTTWCTRPSRRRRRSRGEPADAWDPRYVGLGETLVNAARYRRASPDSGSSTTTRGPPPDWDESLDLPEFGPAGRQREKGFDTSRFDQQLRNPSPASAMTSESSSPQQSPQPLGSPHDLDSFQDLFFRPNMNSAQRTPNEAACPTAHTGLPIPWDNSMRTHRTDSSLTNLARQLSDEFEQMERERERSSSLYSQSVTSSLRQQRRPTEGSLQFVFEEMHRSASPTEGIMDDPIHAFKASETLPEDVISSRASSFIEGTAEDDDPTADDTIAAVFRVGMVESVSTPPAVSSERRLSYTGQTAFANNSLDQQQRSLASPASQDRILSGLQAPLTEATRSSYMTSSTLSRMSNLSDFPAPPKDGSRLAPKHMSLLSSYFDEAMSTSEAQPGALPAASSTSLEEDRVTFGGNQSANDLAKTLSTPQPEPF